jgi:hypothetical protein
MFAGFFFVRIVPLFLSTAVGGGALVVLFGMTDVGGDKHENCGHSGCYEWIAHCAPPVDWRAVVISTQTSPHITRNQYRGYRFVLWLGSPNYGFASGGIIPPTLCGTACCLL